MTAIRWMRSVVIALLLIGAGCAASSPVLSVGAYSSIPDAELFGRVQQALITQGYPVQTSDPVHGTIVVQANFVSRGIVSTFTVQCHRGGWVSFVPAGVYVRRRGNDARMPRALRDEYQSLVMNTMNALGPPSGGAA